MIRLCIRNNGTIVRGTIQALKEVLHGCFYKLGVPLPGRAHTRMRIIIVIITIIYSRLAQVGTWDDLCWGLGPRV